MSLFFDSPQSFYTRMLQRRGCCVEPRTLSHRAVFTHKILDLGGRSYLTHEIIALSYNHDKNVTHRRTYIAILCGSSSRAEVTY